MTRVKALPRRWRLFRPFDLLARLWPVWRKPKGALLIRIDGIGDMVLFHPAFAHYPEALGLPLAEITVLGCASWASLAPQLFPGCRFRAIDEHRYDKNPFYRFGVSLWVRRQGFALVACDIFMRKPLVADSLVYVSGAPRKIVAKPYQSAKTQRAFDWYLRRCQKVIDTGPYPTHEIIRHFRFVSALAGRPIAPAAPRVPWPGAPQTSARPYAVINFGSNEPGRRWPFERFLEIAQTLAARGLQVVFTGGSAEAAQRERLAAAGRAGEFVDRIGATSLPQLLDLLKGAALVVSNDTGPAHLAIGLGAPTVVVVGGGHFQSFVPYPPEATPAAVRFVFRERGCFHCFWNCTEPHAPGGTFPCIEQLAVAEVFAAIEAALSGAADENALSAQRAN
ncbi:MAG: glycosyltransferase family 9 protein [Stellaceae bacterium]